MDRIDLYDVIAARKSQPKDFRPYTGDNGRVNRCVQLMRSGKIRTGGNLLDVGGGIGDLCFAARDMFDEVVNVDISIKNMEAAAAKGIPSISSDVDRQGLPLSESLVDVVTALDFIEHIVDPEFFARECFRVLKPKGEVFINTPNVRFWRHIEALWRRGRMPHTSGDRDVYHGGHLAFFTYHDLREIFEGAGFVSTEQLMDDEGYDSPPNEYLNPLVIDSLPGWSASERQVGYTKLSMELGCPNLLYRAIKP